MMVLYLYKYLWLCPNLDSSCTRAIANMIVLACCNTSLLPHRLLCLAVFQCMCSFVYLNRIGSHHMMPILSIHLNPSWSTTISQYKLLLMVLFRRTYWSICLFDRSSHHKRSMAHKAMSLHWSTNLAKSCKLHKMASYLHNCLFLRSNLGTSHKFSTHHNSH